MTPNTSTKTGLLLALSLIDLSSCSVKQTPSTGPRDSLTRRSTTLIPSDVFESTAQLETNFSYGYPWGNTHNGAALMLPAQVSIVDNYLQLTSTYTGPQAGNAKLTYNSGTVFAKQQFSVAAGGSLDFQADVIAPVSGGCWPAMWLASASGWTPEIDMAEFKGTGLISTNTLNKANAWDSKDSPYPSPAAWHTILVQMQAQANGTTVQVDFSLDGSLIHQSSVPDMVGAPFWLIFDYQMLGSSGTSGPNTTTFFKVRNLSVISNP
ncbi:hypothetical protein P8C59_005932 [Phyllachora maydis]|uniref:GH16 domain-containing protein n=1 Tax=Phyllachora maydis TaxID=1825666 RepID=A0AAD9I5P2_9PEZI|nr:hypothetical protein P8C59_005932 [Phyllachora maydis]